MQEKSKSKSRTNAKISKSEAYKSISNVVKNEICPAQAKNPASTSGSISAYAKLAKNANRFDVNIK